MPELTGVGTSELYSWQSGIALVRALSARLDPDNPPPAVGQWLNDCGAIVTAEIAQRKGLG
jgi:hypothetical protein